MGYCTLCPAYNSCEDRFLYGETAFAFLFSCMLCLCFQHVETMSSKIARSPEGENFSEGGHALESTRSIVLAMNKILLILLNCAISNKR